MIVLAPAPKIVRYFLRLPAACQTLTRMTTCREPKSFNLVQVLIRRRCNLLSKSKSYTIEETVINHIEKKILFWYSAVK